MTKSISTSFKLMISWYNFKVMVSCDILQENSYSPIFLYLAINHFNMYYQLVFRCILFHASIFSCEWVLINDEWFWETYLRIISHELFVSFISHGYGSWYLLFKYEGFIWGVYGVFISFCIWAHLLCHSLMWILGDDIGWNLLVWEWIILDDVFFYWDVYILVIVRYI